MSVPDLKGNQLRAVAPDETVWLSASAGTGKTHVLASRVLRLLLQDDVTPSQILCLTFTKAGAAEMAARINATLAAWVRMSAGELAMHLKAIGADFGPKNVARARTLFAEVLDCPGGGLRIDTIHAFAQWLLAVFPEEAGLAPGTRAMEDRDRALLARRVLAELAVSAEEHGDSCLTCALADLSLRMAPDEVERFLLRCAGAREAWFGPGAWQPPLQPRVNRLLGLDVEANAASLAGLCDDVTFDVAALRACLITFEDWNSATGREGAAAISAWLARDPAQRAATLDDLHAALFTKAGEPRQLGNLAKRDPGYEDKIARVAASLGRARELRALLELAAWLTPALELGREFALAWQAAKEREGFIDFDDQIREAARLLSTRDMAEWIRFKLDRRFDHVLVDEAQDTNAAQWQIIGALTEEFFAGLGQHGEKLRTLFVVGDYKQAIFRFQGTSPENFRQAAERVRRLLRGAERELRDLDLGRSFRTVQPVLDFVDAAIGEIGHEAFGLSTAPERHVGDEGPGQVVLWKPVGLAVDGEEAEDEGEGAGLLSRPDREMADRIARQVKAWLDQGFPLAKKGSRFAGPGDIMVLVRKRRDLAGLIVARLHAAGVPVAGVDRLRLGAPLAVRDLLAALRFAAQPLDDLNLACLLVSPLVGWSQEQLLEHGFRPRQVSLWNQLRQSRDPDVARAIDQLGALLRVADFEPPQALLHWLLVGPWQGRRRLVARLGREANDPIDELLNAAQAYAASQIPSLTGFLAWFDAGAGELKREAEGGGDQVRVMTVHGSKGLQAPIVILADAASNPGAGGGAALDLFEPTLAGDESARAIPLPPLRKEEKVGRIAVAEAEAAVAEAQEHWRLLYVAMTRAEEALFVGGALGKREKEPVPDSWYARLAALFPPEAAVQDPIWGWRLEHGTSAERPSAITAAEPQPEPARPAWLDRAPSAEPRPPRPLAPSSLGEELSPDPPFVGDDRAAKSARRGVLLHKLLERLPDLPVERRDAAALAWLERNGADLAMPERAELAKAALSVIAHPDWAELFVPGALAEVPIAATVAGQVIAGTIDRLVVAPGRVRLVDFKTARRVPAGLDEVPVAILRQMGAYGAALQAIYPDARIEAALLYTAAPRLIELSGEVLSRHKPDFAASEQDLADRPLPR